MKGKIKREVLFTDGSSIMPGTELSITMVSSGKKGDRYRCETPCGKQVVLDDIDVDITDYSPCVDWEQRRYEIARSAMQGYCSFIGTDVDSACMNLMAENALKVADVLINRLRNNNL